MKEILHEEPLMLPSDKRRLADLETRVDRQRNVGLVVLILLTVANIIGLVGNGVILNTMFDSSDEIKRISEHNRTLNEEDEKRSAANATLVSEIVEVVNDIDRVVREHAGLPPGPQVTTPVTVFTTTTTTGGRQGQSRRSTTSRAESSTTGSSSVTNPPGSSPNPGPSTTSPISPICSSIPIAGVC